MKKTNIKKSPKKLYWMIEKRISLDLTQKQLAELSGIKARSYITMIEAGERTPSPRKAIQIAKVLDLNWTRFYE